jgi:nucleoid-associated protein YgaU
MVGSRLQPTNRAAESSREATAIRHEILDGDTLEKLAEKYLGDRRRALEIFRANRNVLNDPEVLPLGEVLIIDASERLTANSENH